MFPISTTGQHKTYAMIVGNGPSILLGGYMMYNIMPNPPRKSPATSDPETFSPVALESAKARSFYRWPSNSAPTVSSRSVRRHAFVRGSLIVLLHLFDLRLHVAHRVVH